MIPLLCDREQVVESQPPGANVSENSTTVSPLPRRPMTRDSPQTFPLGVMASPGMARHSNRRLRSHPSEITPTPPSAIAPGTGTTGPLTLSLLYEHEQGRQEHTVQ